MQELLAVAHIPYVKKFLKALWTACLTLLCAPLARVALRTPFTGRPLGLEGLSSDKLAEMAVVLERNCSMLVHFDKAASASEIKTALEGNDTASRIQAMQTAIKMLLCGESLPAFFITVVRYVLPSEDHTIQKLLLLYLVSIAASLDTYERQERPQSSSSPPTAECIPHSNPQNIVSLKQRHGNGFRTTALRHSVSSFTHSN